MRERGPDRQMVTEDGAGSGQIPIPTEALKETTAGQETVEAVEPLTSREYKEMVGYLEELSTRLSKELSDDNLGRRLAGRPSEMAKRLAVFGKMAEAEEAAEAERKFQERQKSVDEFVSNISTLDFADTHKVVEWLDDLSRIIGYRGVRFDTKKVGEEFTKHGYVPEFPESNDKISEEKDKALFGKYIIQDMLFNLLPATEGGGVSRNSSQEIERLHDLFGKKFPEGE